MQTLLFVDVVLIFSICGLGYFLFRFPTQFSFGYGPALWLTAVTRFHVSLGAAGPVFSFSLVCLYAAVHSRIFIRFFLFTLCVRYGEKKAGGCMFYRPIWAGYYHKKQEEGRQSLQSARYRRVHTTTTTTGR
ncbi:uncharacterized protein BKA78DRAFT_75635 [Phyllosticta capitalensis]|uniref:uncharacterized protein n=1 Tax=Phyllosticta capitalensis TaxID=121624 RepID=UPI00312FAC64